MSVFVVKAKEPTILGAQSFYELLPTDLMLSFSVDTAHVVPGPIDIERFNAALSSTLSVYPLAAGRLERGSPPGGTWKVHLSNIGVPVAFIDSDAEEVVPINTIVQSPWTLTEGIVPRKYFEQGLSNEPLLRVTVTRFTKLNYTSIGLCSSHAIGDGFTVCCFLRLLSQNYQGLEPLDPEPSYDKYPLLSFSPQKFPAIEMPSFDVMYPMRNLLPSLDPSRVKPLPVHLRFSAKQTIEINKAVLSQAPAGAGHTRLSRQDTLVALLAFCITRADPDSPPVQRVSNVFMCRGVEPVPANAACNGLLWTISDPPDGSETPPIYAIATSIRSSLQRIRDPEFAAACTAVQAAKSLKAADNDMGLNFAPHPGHMIVNSTWRIDWTSAHFGYPGRTQFYHSNLSEQRYVKIFQPNPVLLPDGTWQSRAGDAEVTFFLNKDVKERFEIALREELQALGVSGDVEIVGARVA